MHHILIDANGQARGPIVVSCDGGLAGTICDAFDPGGGWRVVHVNEPVARWSRWDGRKFVAREAPVAAAREPTDKERIATLEERLAAIEKKVS